MTSSPKNAPDLILVPDSPKPARDWRKSFGIALPVIQGEAAIFPRSHFSQLVAKEIGTPVEELATQWPEISGKAGELTEIAINHPQIKRIYLVGVGTQTNDDLRK